MFECERYNVQELLSVVLDHPKKHREYPFEISYSTKNSSNRNELFIYLEGRSIWTVGDTTFELEAGDIVLIPHGIDRQRYYVTVLAPVTFVNILFACDSICLSAPQLYRKPSEALNNLFLKLFHIWRPKKDGYYAKSMSIFYDIISHIQTSEKRYLPSAQYEAIEPAIRYLEQNFYKPNFDYAHFARLSGFSYTYFKKLFIKKYGCPPVKQVTNLRIRLSCDLIMTNKYKLTEIAELCGFENVQYFSNTFKKIVGISPSQYMKKE